MNTSFSLQIRDVETFLRSFNPSIVPFNHDLVIVIFHCLFMTAMPVMPSARSFIARSLFLIIHLCQEVYCERLTFPIDLVESTLSF